MATISSINGNPIVVGASGISDGAVNSDKLASGSVTVDKLESILQAQMALEKVTGWGEGAIDLSTSPVDPSSTTMTKTYRSVVVPCAEGDVFVINCGVGSSTIACAFVDSGYNVISSELMGASVANFCVAAPSLSAYLIINDKNSLDSYSGVSSEYLSDMVGLVINNTDSVIMYVGAHMELPLTKLSTGSGKFVNSTSYENVKIDLRGFTGTVRIHTGGSTLRVFTSSVEPAAGVAYNEAYVRDGYTDLSVPISQEDSWLLVTYASASVTAAARRAARMTVTVIGDKRSSGDGSDGDRFRISNFCNSWWCNPRSQYSGLKNTLYFGGVSREGIAGIGVFDIRANASRFVPLWKYEADDHDVPALLAPTDEYPPIVAYSRHGMDGTVKVRVGDVAGDIDSLATKDDTLVNMSGSVNYAQLIRFPVSGVVVLMCRGGGIATGGWYASLSEDQGQTWGISRRLTDRPYLTHSYDQDANFINLAAAYNPAQDVDTVTHDIAPLFMRYADSDKTYTQGELYAYWNGALTDTGVNVLDGDTGYVNTANYDRLSIPSGYNSMRLLDIMPDGSVLAVAMVVTNGQYDTSSGMYGIYERSGGSYTWKAIVATGMPVGYNKAGYIGGMCASRDGSIYLTRESNGTWTAERYVKNGSSYALDATLRESASKLGRPQVAWDADVETKAGAGNLIEPDYLALVEYQQYSSTSYKNYYGDEVLVDVTA